MDRSPSEFIATVPARKNSDAARPLILVVGLKNKMKTIFGIFLVLSLMGCGEGDRKLYPIYLSVINITGTDVVAEYTGRSGGIIFDNDLQTVQTIIPAYETVEFTAYSYFDETSADVKFINGNAEVTYRLFQGDVFPIKDSNIPRTLVYSN